MAKKLPDKNAMFISGPENSNRGSPLHYILIKLSMDQLLPSSIYCWLQPLIVHFKHVKWKLRT